MKAEHHELWVWAYGVLPPVVGAAFTLLVPVLLARVFLGPMLKAGAWSARDGGTRFWLLMVYLGLRVLWATLVLVVICGGAMVLLAENMATAPVSE